MLVVASYLTLRYKSDISDIGSTSQESTCVCMSQNVELYSFKLVVFAIECRHQNSFDNGDLESETK